MKNIIKTIAILLLTSFSMIACAQEKNDSKNNLADVAAPKKEATVAMDKDSLDAKIYAEIEKDLRPIVR
jgi:hypothetical protein